MGAGCPLGGIRREMKKIDLGGALLWLGFGRGVRVDCSGDFGRIVVFLALWGASALPVWGAPAACIGPKDSIRTDLRPQDLRLHWWQCVVLAVSWAVKIEV